MTQLSLSEAKSQLGYLKKRAEHLKEYSDLYYATLLRITELKDLCLRLDAQQTTVKPRIVRAKAPVYKKKEDNQTAEKLFEGMTPEEQAAFIAFLKGNSNG